MSAVASALAPGLAAAQQPARELPASAASLLPDPAAWAAAAARHEALFAPLDDGACIALIARSAPAQALLWVAGDSDEGDEGDEGDEPGSGGLSGQSTVSARLVPFAGYSDSGADIVLAADDESLAAIKAALDGGAALFEVLRAAIRAGHVVCYMLRRRCVLEERGFDEMLEALGFVFMGACR